MNRRRILTSILAAILFCGGWLIGQLNFLSFSSVDKSESEKRDEQQLRQSVAKTQQHVGELERELANANRDLAEQRKIIRQHALSATFRSVDDLLALFPAKYPVGNWAPAEKQFEDCWFETADGIRLHGWYLPHQESRAAILFLHGNAGNITHRAAVVGTLQRRFSVSVFVFDFRGYGRSEGIPTIEGLALDARAARNYLATRSRLPPREIVLLGESLGGALAVQLASDDGARGLILQSTFSSLKDVAVVHYPELLVNVLVADRLDSAASIIKYHGPLLQSHGDVDGTIPFSLGQALFDAANEPKSFIRLPGGDHNDPLPEQYFRELEKFFSTLPPPKI